MRSEQGKKRAVELALKAAILLPRSELRELIKTRGDGNGAEDPRSPRGGFLLLGGTGSCWFLSASGLRVRSGGGEGSEKQTFWGPSGKECK